MSTDRTIDRVIETRLHGRIDAGMPQDGLAVPAQQIGIGMKRDDTFGQSSGLVRTEDVHTTQIFDRQKLLDDDLRSGHGLGPLRQYDACDGGKQLWRHSHRQRQSEFQRFNDRMREFLFRRKKKDLDHENGCYKDQGDANQQISEIAKTSFKPGFRCLKLKSGSDSSEFRIFSRMNRNRRRHATHDMRAKKKRVCSKAERGFRRQNPRRLFDRVTFAR